jgi:acylphosphatase
MSEAGTPLVRRCVLYSGHVQGVGFRMTAHGVARRFRVTGWVRNLPDGKVQLEAQGAPAEVDRFLNAIAEEFGGFVRNADMLEREPTDDERGFEIRR